MFLFFFPSEFMDVYLWLILEIMVSLGSDTESKNMRNVYICNFELYFMFMTQIVAITC